MAIGDKIPVVMGSDLAVPGGVATLDREGKLPAAQRPDYSISQVAGLQDALDEKQGTLAFDAEPTEGSDNPVRSGGVYDALSRKQDTLTGVPGQLIGISGDGTAQATVYPYNKNLLDNWYFANPVNQMGETEYTSIGYVCDRWYNRGSKYVRLNKDGIVIGDGPITSSSYGSLNQRIKNPEKLFGKTLTVSFLINKNTMTSAVSAGICRSNSVGTSSNALITIPIPPGSTSLFSGTVKFPDDLGEYSGANVFLWLSTVTGEIGVQAVKLELGPIQTLAHKEGDEWVLNEIPNYAEQYAICEQYSPITGEFVGSQHSNPNLLDNWYFVGGGFQQGDGQFPINQRGKTEQFGTNNIVYGIDRWGFYSTSGGKLSVLDDCIEIDNTIGDTESTAGFVQRLEAARLESGRTYTLSALIEIMQDAESGANSLFSFSNGTDKSTIISSTFLPRGANGKFEVFTHTFTLEEAVNNLYNFRLRSSSGKGKVRLKAMKLELGPIQTLAHKEGDEWVLNDPPPNYALELAKCQRYFARIGPTTAPNTTIATGISYSSTSIYLSVSLPTTLRANPAISASGSFRISASTNFIPITDISFNKLTGNIVEFRCAVSEATPGAPYGLNIETAGSYIDVSAEL